MVLAGCLSGPGSTSPQGDVEALRLSELARCEFNYPDGRAVPCENYATPLVAVAGSAPPGWICRERVGDASRGFALRQSLTSDEWGITYDSVGTTTPVSGTIRATNGDSVRLFNWTDGGSSGFLRMPDVPPPGTSLDVSVYHTAYRSNTSTLQGGKLEQLWTLYGGQAWPVHRITTSDGAYYAMVVLEFLGNYQIASFTFEGVDFDLALRYEKGFNAGTEFVGIGPLPLVDLDCS